MNVSRAALLSALSALAPGAALAQQSVIHDTLSADTPTAVTCGFCATERFGVVFRELPSPRRGIDPEDFPIRLESVQIAIAAATVTGGTSCTPSETGGTITAPVEIYAGSEVPTGAITSLSADGPWSATEELVWAADAPLALSTATPGGGGRYELSFNELVVRDETDAPIVIESGTYIRVVVTLPAADPAVACTGGLDRPAGFPFRDSDGRIAPERSYIYAAGVGWLWNEQASIDGDWGIRLTLFRAPPRDGGAPELDAGSGADAATEVDAAAPSDAGSGADAGAPPAEGGCGCRAAARDDRGWMLGAAAVLLLVRRRRRQSSSTV